MATKRPKDVPHYSLVFPSLPPDGKILVSLSPLDLLDSLTNTVVAWDPRRCVPKMREQVRALVARWGEQDNMSAADAATCEFFIRGPRRMESFDDLPARYRGMTRDALGFIVLAGEHVHVHMCDDDDFDDEEEEEDEDSDNDIASQQRPKDVVHYSLDLSSLPSNGQILGKGLPRSCHDTLVNTTVAWDPRRCAPKMREVVKDILARRRDSAIHTLSDEAICEYFMCGPTHMKHFDNLPDKYRRMTRSELGFVVIADDHVCKHTCDEDSDNDIASQ